MVVMETLLVTKRTRMGAALTCRKLALPAITAARAVSFMFQ